MRFWGFIFVHEHSMRRENRNILIVRVRLFVSEQAYLGKPVASAVIAVPAHFNAAQRAATRLAGERAGLKVLRLLSEPMAAAMAYGLAIAGSKPL